MANRVEKFNLEKESVAWYYFLAELHFVYAQEVCRPAFGFFNLIEYKQTATLSHCLYLKNARHDGFLWEVSCKERLVGCHVLDTDDTCRTYCDNLVDKLHRITVGKQLANTYVVHYRSIVGVVYRSLHLVLAYFLTHEPCKLVVYGVTGACGYNTSLDWFAYESHIADYVEKLVACAFVFPHKRLVLYVPDFLCIHVRNLQHIGKLVEFLLCHFALIYDNGVVEVAALDKVGFEKRYYIAYENECAGR